MSSDDVTPGSLWRNRSFVRLFLAHVVSLVGSGATTVGLALFAHRLTGGPSASVIGNALMLRILAFMIFSQPAGVLADRVDRKVILVLSDVARAALLALLPWASTVWHVYTLVFAINAVTAFFTPSYEASVPAVVGESNLVKALSVSRVAVDLEAVAAPAAAGVIVVLVGTRWVFWFDAVTYLVSAVLVLSATIPSTNGPTVELSLRTFVAEVTYGTRAILREPALRQAIMLSFVEATAGAVAIVATVSYVQDVLHRGESSVAFLMAALGVGSSLGAVMLGRLTGRYESGIDDRQVLHGRRHEWARLALLGGGLCLGLVLLPGVLVPPFVVALLLWALNGAGQALIAISSATLLAEHTLPEERGRAYAAHFALTHACWLFTYPGVGHAAERWGTPVTFTAAGAVCFIVTLLASTQRSSHHPHAHETTTAKAPQ